jgi:alginate O-acetyltransferase complex protein AlgI
MSVFDPLRPTGLPALLFLVWLPVFLLVPPRWTRTLFLAASVVTLVAVEGPVLAAGLLGAVVVGFFLTEMVFRLQRGRRLAFAGLWLLIHVGAAVCFRLPLPAAYAATSLRFEDKAANFILFSGIGATFLRLVSFAWDRYRGTCGPTRFVDYLSYMTFFPQFRHGPVERCGSFAGQLAQARQAWTPRDALIGLLRIAVAFATLKVLVSMVRLIARHWNFPLSSAGLDVMANPEQLGLAQLAVLIHAPLLVIYILESSFVSLQLGVSRMFGVRGTENFRYPLLSMNPREVWHRWNITVSAWLRDYVYFPLGGGHRRKYLNVFLVFVYCGLMHDMQLRCIAWGVWTGGTLALYLWLADRMPARPTAAQRPTLVRAVGRFLARLLTYHWLCIGVTILLDPAHLGLRVLARWVHLLVGAFMT